MSAACGSTCQSDEEVRTAFTTMEDAVGEKARPQHFLGVTVQPMLNWTATS
jgi:hypothetical protein